MNSKIFVLVLIYSCAVDLLYAQGTRAIDSLLFDAQYEKTIQVIDNQLRKTPASDSRIVLENKKAEALIRLGNFREAESLLMDLSSRSLTSSQRALIETNYGSLYMNQGRNDLSLESLQSALANFQKDNKENTLDAAQSLAYLGNLYRTTGKYAQAEEQLMRSLAIRQKYLKGNNEWIAASYNDLGLVYSQIDNDKALEYYEKALAIYEKLHGKDHPKIAIAKTNIGFIYSRMELYGDATNNFESALKTWEKIYPQAHPTKAFLLFNLGETYQKVGNAKAANEYFEKAIAMYQQSYGKKHPDIASVFNAVGNVRLSENKFDDALGYFQRALQANVSDFSSIDISTNPRLDNFYNGTTLLYSLMNKAQALEARYYGKTIKIKDLELAVATLQVCDTLIDRLRQRIANEADKLSLGVIANEVYANGVRMAFETGEAAFKKKSWYALSFFFAEKSKSAVLLEAISDVNAKSFARIPDNLLQQERSLKAAIALTAQKLAQKPSEQEEKLLREVAFKLNRSYEAFTKELETKFPEYYNLKFNAASPSIPELQSKMEEKTAIISYFVDDKVNRVYIFIITKGDYKIINRSISADFDKYITGLRNSLYFNDQETYAKSAEKLSSELIPRKIPASVNDLVILPTGRLSIVPFETLLTASDNKKGNAAGHPSYLINKYSIRYEFSAALILQKAAAKRSQHSSILLCAPVTFESKDNLNELPGTESEVKEISQLFASRNYKNTIFIRQQANEKVAKSGTLKDYSYLHFATHGIVDEKSPELSRIFLQSSSDTEDGNLFTGEIYNLELNANLVTLSACQTGLGKISKGEGVIGLSRALVYAGAKNIIVSFWSVADESTAILMTEFYRQMLEHPESNYSENLRNAKMNLMRTEKYQSPYYWAPFVLIGF
jgi:CHAT domain-containing protein/uncharacterized protein HemY